MHLVDNEYAEPALGGRIFHLLHNIADVIDAVVGSGVKLRDIEVGFRRDCAAGGALPAGIAVALVFAVDGARKNAGDRRLAGPSRPAEKVAVSDSVRYDLIS